MSNGGIKKSSLSLNRANRVIVAIFAAHIGVGTILPVVPLHLVNELHASGTELGLVLATFPIAALLGRFIGGHGTDKFGARRIIIAGILGCALAGALFMLPLSALGIAGVRTIQGVAQSLVWVAGVAWILELGNPDRQTHNLNLVGASSWGGVTFGTLLGSVLQYLNASGAVAAIFALCAFPLATSVREATRTKVINKSKSLISRAAILPGVLFGLGAVSFSAMGGFVVLHLNARSVNGALILSLFTLLVLLGRFFVVPLAVKVGLEKALTLSFISISLGLLLVALAQNIYIASLGTILISLGHCVLWPAAGTLALSKTDLADRGSTVGTMGAFFDISMGGSAAIFGFMIFSLGSQTVFIAAAAIVLCALTIHLVHEGRKSEI